MLQSYQGNRKPFALAVYDPSDAVAVLPVLERLAERDLALSYGGGAPKERLKRSCALLAFLSPAAAANTAVVEAVLYAHAQQTPIVCVYLEETRLPETLKRVLYTTNAVNARSYPDAASLAERMMTSSALQNPVLTSAQKSAAKRVALLLIAGALVVAGLAAALVVRQLAGRAQEQTVASITEEPPTDVAGLLASGMTEADLLEITELVLVGDRSIDPSKIFVEDTDWNDVIVQTEMDGQTAFLYEGERIPRGTMQDLSLLGYMKNLRQLLLINQGALDLTPLSQLTKLEGLVIADCEVDSVAPLAGMTSLTNIGITGAPVTDYTPLAGCTNLKRVCFSDKEGGPTTLDGLGIAGLEEIELLNVPNLRDLDALAGCENLKLLTLQTPENLRSLEGLRGLQNLEEINLRYSDGVTLDLSPLSDCPGVKRLELEAVPVRDLSCTAGFTSLQRLMCTETLVTNLDFLRNVNPDYNFDLSVSNDRMTDYSELAAIPRYQHLHINLNGRAFSLVQPYLENVEWLGELSLRDCNGIDIASLPENISRLEIYGGNTDDLTGLAQRKVLLTVNLGGLNYLTSLASLSDCPSLSNVFIEDCPRLTELAGLSNCSQLRSISINNCPSLTDIDALYELPLNHLTIENTALRPDFSRIHFQDNWASINLINASGMTDLTFLNELSDTDAARVGSLYLQNMDWLTDLSPIKRLSIDHLTIPPQLEEQAEAMREESEKAGKEVFEYAVAYPTDAEWNEDVSELSLISLDELDTLPDVLLARVGSLCVVGDRIVDWNVSNWTQEWKNNQPHYAVEDKATGVASPVGKGAITSFEKLQKLTGLHELELIDQPVTDLTGIQNLSGLSSLTLISCDITDASPAFTLTELQGLFLGQTQLASIQGVQNLPRLKMLSLNDTQVSDLSPLKACDFSAAAENGGLELELGSIPCEDFSALSGIPQFSRLFFNQTDVGLILPFIKDAKIDYLELLNANLTNDDLLVVASIPGLRELKISWNNDLTDLTPLLASQTLEKVCVSHTMEDAIASIADQTQFELEIEQ